MSEWTSERIEAVELVLATSDDGWPANVNDDIAALARIGLAVVKADPETVERVALALCGAGNSTPGFMGVDVEEAIERMVSGNDKPVCAGSCVPCRNVGRAALAALREMGCPTPPQTGEIDD